VVEFVPIIVHSSRIFKQFLLRCLLLLLRCDGKKKRHYLRQDVVHHRLGYRTPIRLLIQTIAIINGITATMSPTQRSIEK
jgi:hypothetical protein